MENENGYSNNDFNEDFSNEILGLVRLKPHLTTI